MRKLLHIHGNCQYYNWSKKPDRIGGCSNRGWTDYRYLNVHPLEEACEDFDELKERGLK